MTVANLPAIKPRLDDYRHGQVADPVCSKLFHYCREGWPTKAKLEQGLRRYWRERGELTIHNNLLLYGTQIVVPKSLQRRTLQKIHEGHQGIVHCHLRARISVWWPGLSQQIQDLVDNCAIIMLKRPNITPRHEEPLLPPTLPDYPWQRIAADLFFLKGINYLAVMDYYSRYPEVIRLKATYTSSDIITALKSIFSRYGIPEILRSDNGPQFTSHEFREFAKSYGFSSVTSSPLYPRSNGQAERTVQTLRKLLTESDDLYLALLNYRSTRLPWCNLSPAELLMGRQLRTTLPLHGGNGHMHI